MKVMWRNKTAFWYCLYDGTERITDEDGNESGETRVLYQEPVKMLANVSPATGYAQTEMFGNLEGYDKVIVTDDLDCPIDENTVLFIDKEPEHNKDGELMPDYIVRRVARSLNSVSIAVRKVNVS